MIKTTLIRNAKLVNEGEIYHADVYIKGNIIEKIERQGIAMEADMVINAEGKYLLPGLINNQVHFREPGLTHKGEIYTKAQSSGSRWSYLLHGNA